MEPKVTIEFENTILEMTNVFEFQMGNGLDNQVSFSCKGLGELKEKEKDMSFIDTAKELHNKWLKTLLQETKDYYAGMSKKETIQVEDYVIASRDKETKKYWSIAAVSPSVYKTYQDAIAEANRLAQVNPTAEFIVLAVAAVASVATINRTYKL